MAHLDPISLGLLKHTRLNDKQASVYLALLQLGKGTVSEIATIANLKRPITYIILAELHGMGYARELPEAGKIMTYAAADPAAIFTEMEQNVRNFREMLPYLRAMQRSAGKPYVTYYSGHDGAASAFSQIRKPKEARYALSGHEAMKVIPDEVERWKKMYQSGKAAKGGRHLLTDTPEDYAYGDVLKQAGQVVRYLLPGQGFGIDLALADNKVFLTSFDEVIHVTVIESEVVYSSLCILFDLAWENSREEQADKNTK